MCAELCKADVKSLKSIQALIVEHPELDLFEVSSFLITTKWYSDEEMLNELDISSTTVHVFQDSFYFVAVLDNTCYDTVYSEDIMFSELDLGQDLIYVDLVTMDDADEEEIN